jgi:hypothetical protein
MEAKLGFAPQAARISGLSSSDLVIGVHATKARAI